MTRDISIVIPVFNEADNIRLLTEEIRNVFRDKNITYTYTIIFVDDGSSDESVTVMQELVEEYFFVQYIELSRNFGKEAALSAGIHMAGGDVLILMDADLQHPPALIPELINEWEKGADVVIGVRKVNPDETLFRKIGSAFFRQLMRMTGDVATVTGATDYRLIDRKVVNQFTAFTERGRITRGLIDWLGFRRSYVFFEARKRHAGIAQYGPKKLFGLAISAIVSNSMVPLRLAGYIGLIVTIFSGSLGLFLLIEQIILGDPWKLEIPATALLAVMIMFLNGILLISIGLVSLYIEKIYHEAKNRPLFVIRSSSHTHE